MAKSRKTPPAIVDASLKLLAAPPEAPKQMDLPFPSPGKDVVYRTTDYEVYIAQMTEKEMENPDLRTVYYIWHPKHGTVGSSSRFLPEAINVANNLQADLGKILGPKPEEYQ